MKTILFLIAIAGAPYALAYGQAKNVILFIGDGGGVTSLNAASIYGYGKAQALYLQSMPSLALADTSTATEWVTGAEAASTAMATGRKVPNGVLSVTPGTGHDAAAGQIYKTILEYAEEKGLATGIVENSREGLLYDAVAAFYAHADAGFEDLDIYHQFLNPRFGDGPDVVLATSNPKLNASVQGGVDGIGTAVKAKGYAFVKTMEEVASLDPGKTRVIAMFASDDFDIGDAVKNAVARLSRNPKGFFLVVHSDCHLAKTRPSLVRLINLDNAIRSVAEERKTDTLILYTADHGYELYTKGEKSIEASKATDHKRILEMIHLEDQHTAEEVPFVAIGPGSDRVKGFVSNTDVFKVMMAGFGWQ